jgi:deoxyribodipyrimidine photo-lyase
MSDTALVWFRRDLRVHDHPPLRAALDAHERVVPVFVLDERLTGGRFPSANRAHFLTESLRELRAALQQRGGTLVLRSGEPERELPALAAETDSGAVYFASDVSPFALARDRRVEAALREAGVEPRRTPGNFVADFGQLKPYAVFTPFWRAWRELPRREVHGAPRVIRTPSDLRIGEIPRVDAESPEPPPPGENAARERMHAFVRDGLDRYSDRHDRLAGGTSGLSPYLHFGCLSARELEEEAAAGDAFTRQLAWRDFYAQVLYRHPDNARHAYRRELDAIEWTGGDDDLAAWAEGRTGYPVVDAGMRQLAATGWMHNRARLITASFLVKDLHVDWRRGETHFMRLLACGDVAQNNGNWQWISSVGVDPAPVYRRLYNPVLQQRRHDPEGEYVRRWVPELREVPLGKLAAPWEMSDAEQREAGCVVGHDYPEPIVDHAVERKRFLDAYGAARGS